MNYTSGEREMKKKGINKSQKGHKKEEKQKK